MENDKHAGCTGPGSPRFDPCHDCAPRTLTPMERRTDPVEALRDAVKSIDELCRIVNSYAHELGLGRKVNADDWTERARAAIAEATGEA